MFCKRRERRVIWSFDNLIIDCWNNKGILSPCEILSMIAFIYATKVVCIHKDWQVGTGEGDGVRALIAFYPQDQSKSNGIKQCFCEISGLTAVWWFGSIAWSSEHCNHGPRCWLHQIGVFWQSWWICWESCRFHPLVFFKQLDMTTKNVVEAFFFFFGRLVG